MTVVTQNYSLVSMMVYVKNGAIAFYEEAKNQGELQNRVHAATRTIIGVASIYVCPGSAVLGGLAASAAPRQAKEVVKFSDGMISGLWNRMSFHQKMVASVVGVSVGLSVGTSIILIPAGIFAAKLGAELALKNSQKEALASASRQLEEKMSEE